ncbi:MAG: hypothetical protein V1663_05815 [archaeon]
MASDKEKTIALTFILLSIIAIIYSLILFLIHLFRILFWVSLIGIIISIISTIVFSFLYFRNKDDYWDSDDYGWIALISFVAFIVLYFLTGLFYNGGYSDEAIRTEMEARQYLDWYNNFVNIPNAVMEETINSLCEDPNYPCENVKQGYIVYKEVVGWKDKADVFSKILITTN